MKPRPGRCRQYPRPAAAPRWPRTSSATDSRNSACATALLAHAACVNGATSIRQLHTVGGEQHGWRLNTLRAAPTDTCHVPLLAGLLGNVGLKSDDDELVPGRAWHQILRHPGAHLSKKPGRWLVAAELVDTTPLWPRPGGHRTAAAAGIAGHLLKKQLLEPHWEKKAAEVVALEGAQTLYGIVVYNNKRVNFGNVDPVAAREIFIREYWPGVGHASALPGAQPQADRTGAWSTRHAARTCWLTNGLHPRLLRPAVARRGVQRCHAGALVPRRGRSAVPSCCS